MLLVEKYCKKNNCTIQIIHDNQEQYQDYIQEMVRFIKNSQEFYDNDGDLKHIESEMIFMDDKDNVLLQGADLLAGSINMMLKKRNINWRNEESTTEIVNFLMPYFGKCIESGSMIYFMDDPNQFLDFISFYGECVK